MRVIAINPLDAVMSVVVCSSFDITEKAASQVMLERRQDVGLNGIEGYIRDKYKSQKPEFVVVDAVGVPSLTLDLLEDEGLVICRLVPDGPAVKSELFENRKAELYFRLHEYGDRNRLKMVRGKILKRQFEDMRPPKRDDKVGGRWRLEKKKEYEEDGRDYKDKPELDTSAYCFVRKTDFQEEELPSPVITIGENPEYPNWGKEDSDYDPESGHFTDDYMIIGE